MADLTVTAANVREGNAIHNRRTTILPDATITAGQPIYRKTNGKAGVARGNAVGTSKLVGIALAPGAAGAAAIEALWQGPLFGFDLSGMDPGETVYLSAATAGTLADAAATGTGNVVVAVGTVHVMTDPAATKYLLVDIPQNAEPVALSEDDTMTLLGGILKVADTTPLNTIPVRELTDAIALIDAKYTTERADWSAFFVQQETTEHQVYHKLGGTDEGQELGEDGAPIETRVTGRVEVAFPWRRYGWAVGWTYEAFARMTVADLEANMADKQGGNAKRHLREMFRALFAEANYAYADPDVGSLTIRRLANGDGTTYPPPFNSDTAGDDDHYLVSGYAATALSATNNPFLTLRDEIVEHFGTGAQVVAIINSAQRAEVVTDMPNFVDAPTAGITPGDSTAVANAVGVPVPGTFLGVEGDSGVYVYVNEEGRVPANYIYAGAVGAPAPLWRRVPREATLQGFRLESEHEHDPMFKRIWRDRFGYAVANRLSAAIMFLDAGSTFTTPAAYA